MTIWVKLFTSEVTTNVGWLEWTSDVCVCVNAIALFRVPPGLCIKTRLSAQPLIRKWFFILMQIKLTFTGKVVHLASFWKWGFLELGSGLLEWAGSQGRVVWVARALPSPSVSFLPLSYRLAFSVRFFFFAIYPTSERVLSVHILHHLTTLVPIKRKYVLHEVNWVTLFFNLHRYYENHPNMQDKAVMLYHKVCFNS